MDGALPRSLIELPQAITGAVDDGDRLGEVGGRIVAEVLYGVIMLDPESYLSVDPGWTPTLPGRQDRFRLVDLLVPAT